MTFQVCYLPSFDSFGKWLVGNIYGRFSLKIAHFVPIRYQTWPPQTILVSDWLISKKIVFSETALPNGSKFDRP
jgi:hypothetical protein